MLRRKRNLKIIRLKKIYSILISLIFIINLYSFQTNIKSSAESNNLEKNTKVSESILWRVGSGLEGEITTEIKIGDLNNDKIEDSILVGTENAIWLLNLETGSVIIKYYTKAEVSSISFIKDADRDGKKDVIFSTLSQKEPNIILLSSENGNIIWEFEPIAEVFTEYQGFQKRETKTWCISIIKNARGEENVLVSSWKFIYLLDGKTGSEIWKFKGNDDIWTCSGIADLNDDKNTDVIAGSQDGDVYFLDGITGKEIWHRDLTKSYKLRGHDSEEGNVIDLNVWNVLEIEDIDSDGLHDIVVTSENGYVYLLSGKNGKEIWKFKALELKKVEDEVGFDNFNFFNIKAQIVGDMDGDEKDDIVIYKRTTQSTSVSFMEDEGYEIQILSSNPKKNIENREILEITNTDDYVLDKVKYIYGDMDFNNDGLIDLVIPLNGKEYRSKINFFTNVKEKNVNNTLFEFSYDVISQVKIVKEKFMVLATSNGIMLVNYKTGKIIWDRISYDDLEIIEFSDINKDGFSDLLFVEYLHYDYKIKRLSTIDKKTGREFWNYSVSLNDLENSSLNTITIIPDISGDGIDEIGTYIRHYNKFFSDWEYEITHNLSVILINGKNGKEIWNVPPTPYDYYTDWRNKEYDIINKNIQTIEYVQDIDGDNSLDIVLGGDEMSIYFLNGKNGSLIQHYSQKFPDENENMQDIYFRAFENYSWKYEWISNLDGKINKKNESEFSSTISIGKHEIMLIVTDKNNEKLSDKKVFNLTTYSPDTHFWNVDFNGNWTWEDDYAISTTTSEVLFFKFHDRFLGTIDFGDGNINENIFGYGDYAIIEHVYNNPGTYFIKMNNTYGYTDKEIKIQKVIIRENDQPMAEIGVSVYENHEINNNSQFDGIVGRNIEFHSDSKPTVNDKGNGEYIENVSWDLGDGTISFEEHPIHIYNKTGIYNVKLTVKNSIGKTDTDEMTVIVRNASQPIAHIHEPNVNHFNAHYVGRGNSFGKRIEKIPHSLNIKVLRNKNKEERFLFYGHDDSVLMSTDLQNEFWRGKNLWEVKLVDDRDGDGFSDILARGESEYYSIVGSKTGEVLIDISKLFYDEADYEYRNYIIENFDDYLVDLNDDGIEDLVYYSQMDRPLISAFDSKNKKELWTFNKIEEKYWFDIPPMVSIEDVDGDDIKDFAVATQRTDNEKGGEIWIISGKTGKEINKLIFEKQKNFEEWIRIIPIGIININDVNGDEKQDFAIMRNTNDGGVLEFLDSTNAQIIRSFPINYGKIINNVDINDDKKSDLLLSTDINVFCLNSAFEIEILEPQSGNLKSDKLFLKWDIKDMECEVIVDDISYGFFDNGETKLTLSSGKHEIKVKIYDEFGGSVSDVINVKISEKKIVKVINYLGLGTLIAVIVINIILPKIKKRNRKIEMDKRRKNKKNDFNEKDVKKDVKKDDLKKEDLSKKSFEKDDLKNDEFKKNDFINIEFENEDLIKDDLKIEGDSNVRNHD